MKVRIPYTPIALALAILGLVTLADLAGQVGQPFAGFLVSPRGVVGFRDPPAWTGPRAGLKPGERVVEADGRPVLDGDALQAAAAAHPVGTHVAYRLADGRQVDVPTMTFSWADFCWAFALGTLGGLTHLALGLGVLRARPTSPAARALWWYCLGIAGFFIPFAAGLRHPNGLILEYGVAALLTVPILDLATTFPADLPRLRRALRWVGGACSVVMLAFLAWGLTDGRMMPTVFQVQIVPPILALGLLLALWTWQAFDRRNPPQHRAQARVVGLGMAVAMAPACLYTLAQLAGAPLPALDLSLVTLTAFPASVAFAILRYGLLDVSRLARQVGLYAALSAILAAVYVLAAFVAGEAAGPGLGAIAVALALPPLHTRLRRLVDQGRLGNGDGALGVLANFGVRASSGVRDLEASLVEATQRLLGATWVALEPLPAGAESAFTVPLASGNQVLGTLAVGPRLLPRQYTDEERALVRALATQAALGLRHARLADEQVQLRVSEALATALAAERAALIRQMVHDLATDLSNLAVALELAKEDPSSPRPWASARRSLEHIEAFLAEKRGQVTGAEPARRCEAGPVLVELCEALAAAGRPIDRVADPGPAAVGLSESELRQVLANVLDNALKFSPAGGRVRVVARAVEATLVIDVADDGPGIAMGLLPGQRGDATMPGSGLGLTNATAVLARAGGDLAWRNGDQGAIVSVRLPLAPWTDARRD
ncbi:MAG: hypothetical protein JWM80_727 [Cyanobacteria bacterium RYN_339]|nr:hypothetical protein [Cyanobacteria bacterium RYN_339]